VWNCLHPAQAHEYEKEEIPKTYFKNNRIFFHTIAHFHYTTYDLCREEDFINVNSKKRVVMVYTPDAQPHPWRYAVVIRILHVDGHMVNQDMSEAQRVDALWVRWLATDPTHPFGASVKRLERVEYMDPDDPEAYGFVHPDEVIRGVHIEPAVAHGKSRTRSPKLVRDEDSGDWRFHYIGRWVTWTVWLRRSLLMSSRRFADRDLSSRFLGKGVGLGLNQAQAVDPLPRPENPDQYKYNMPADAEDPTENDHFGAVPGDNGEDDVDKVHFGRPAHVDSEDEDQGDDLDDDLVQPARRKEHTQEGGLEYDEEEDLYADRYGHL
jgi:hypothetical protein